MSRQVKIIGAGFSGLTLGYFLAKSGIVVNIFEKSGRVGGLIESKKTDWGIVETAATSYINSQLFELVMADLNLQRAERGPDIKKRFIFRETPKRWPLQFSETLKMTKGVSQALIGLAKSKTKENEPIREWVQRNMGPAAFDYLVGPALQGIYASQELNAEIILASLFKKSTFAKPAIKGSVAPLNGMQEITDGLAQKIIALGGKINLNVEVDIDKTRPVVLAVPAKTAAVLMATEFSELAQGLARIDYLPVTTVTATFAKDQPHLSGFGCLFPQAAGFNSLGVLVNSSIFSNRGNDNMVLETWIFAGVERPNTLAMLIGDRAKLLAVNETKILNSVVTSWPSGIPHYNNELNSFVKKYKCPPGVYLTGNYLGQVGLAKILESNYFLAEKIKGEL